MENRRRRGQLTHFHIRWALYSVFARQLTEPVLLTECRDFLEEQASLFCSRDWQWSVFQKLQLDNSDFRSPTTLE